MIVVTIIIIINNQKKVNAIWWKILSKVDSIFFKKWMDNCLNMEIGASRIRCQKLENYPPASATNF
jgi:hypothetical protein